MSITTLTSFPLAELPYDLIVKILHTMPYRSAGRLVRTNKTMYTMLIKELYKSTKIRGWFPLGFACATNNLRTLSLCLDAGAPIDQHIPKDLGSHRWVNTSFYMRNADPDTTREEAQHCDRSPLAYAYQRGNDSNIDAMQARVICFALFDAGADFTTLSVKKRVEFYRMMYDQTYLPAAWS
ncbi:hypothetical protein FSST1_004584 [Fusarium sambucinum]